VASVAAINAAPGATGINVTRGAGLTPVSASFAINSSTWDASTADEFYRFGFTTTTAYRVDTLTVGLRSSGTGPGFVDLLYSKDGGAFTPLSSVNPVKLVGTDFTNLAAPLSEVGTVRSSLIFLLEVDPNHRTNAQFNQDATLSSAISPSGTFRFGSYAPPGTTNVFVNPTIIGAAVPEPASWMLLGLGMTLVLRAGASRRLKSAA
jgi:hypothetical protein